MRKRVLMVLEAMYPAADGGVEFQVRYLAKKFVEQGYAVTVIAPMVWFGPQQEYSTVDGVPVYRIPYPGLRLIGGVVMLVRLGRYLLQHQDEYDVIHAHVANKMAAVACVIGDRLGKPVIVKLTGAVELNDGILKSGVTTPRIWLLRWAMRRATYFQAISQRIASLLKDKGFAEETVQWVPNAVDINKHNKKVENVAKVRDTRVVVFLGRLVKEKGLSHFLAAWKEAVDPTAKIEMRIFGGGYLNNRLKRQVRRLGIERQVLFLGATDKPAEAVRAADLCVLPSLVEGLSNTLLEYMAERKPVLGSKISGTEDFVIDGETGWLFESRNHEQLVEKLRLAVAASDDQLRVMGEKARQRVEKYASPGAVISRLLELYGFNGTLRDEGPSRLSRLPAREGT
jgi:glycosyltransferase involved in cell wall biosynthesis